MWVNHCRLHHFRADIVDRAECGEAPSSSSEQNRCRGEEAPPDFSCVQPRTSWVKWRVSGRDSHCIHGIWFPVLALCLVWSNCFKFIGCLCLQRAIEEGADFIEADIQATKDGILVCAHDVILDDTTDVADHKEFDDRKTTYEVQGVNVTGWFIGIISWPLSIIAIQAFVKTISEMTSLNYVTEKTLSHFLLCSWFYAQRTANIEGKAEICFSRSAVQWSVCYLVSSYCTIYHFGLAYNSLNIIKNAEIIS